MFNWYFNKLNNINFWERSGKISIKTSFKKSSCVKLYLYDWYLADLYLLLAMLISKRLFTIGINIISINISPVFKTINCTKGVYANFLTGLIQKEGFTVLFKKKKR